MDQNLTANIPEEQDLSEILRIRREKLEALQNAGNDPYHKVKYDRTAYSQDIKDDYATYEGKTVGIAGSIQQFSGERCPLGDHAGIGANMVASAVTIATADAVVLVRSRRSSLFGALLVYRCSGILFTAGAEAVHIIVAGSLNFLGGNGHAAKSAGSGLRTCISAGCC